MPSDHEQPPRPDEGSRRAEYFSDAILAIAITLLVIEIKVPDGPGAKLGDALQHLWPSYLAYVLSFSTIGLVWIAHHSMFQRILRTTRPLLMLNLFLLLCVAFLPFSTAVLSQYSATGSAGAVVAAELYSINMLLIGLAFLCLWIFLYYRPMLLADGVDRRGLRGSIVRSTFVPAAYVVTALLARLSTTACFVIWIVTTVYVALGPSSERLFRRMRRAQPATGQPN